MLNKTIKLALALLVAATISNTMEGRGGGGGGRGSFGGGGFRSSGGNRYSGGGSSSSSSGNRSSSSKSKSDYHTSRPPISLGKSASTTESSGSLPALTGVWSTITSFWWFARLLTHRSSTDNSQNSNEEYLRNSPAFEEDPHNSPAFNVLKRRFVTSESILNQNSFTLAVALNCFAYKIPDFASYSNIKRRLSSISFEAQEDEQEGRIITTEYEIPHKRTFSHSERDFMDTFYAAPSKDDDPDTKIMDTLSTCKKSTYFFSNAQKITCTSKISDDFYKTLLAQRHYGRNFW